MNTRIYKWDSEESLNTILLEFERGTIGQTQSRQLPGGGKWKEVARRGKRESLAFKKVCRFSSGGQHPTTWQKRSCTAEGEKAPEENRKPSVCGTAPQALVDIGKKRKQKKEAAWYLSHWEKQVVSGKASIIYVYSQQGYLSLPPYIYLRDCFLSPSVDNKLLQDKDQDSQLSSAWNTECTNEYFLKTVSQTKADSPSSRKIGPWMRHSQHTLCLSNKMSSWSGLSALCSPDLTIRCT